MKNRAVAVGGRKAIALALASVFAAPAQAGTWYVTSANDAGANTLRWALEQANADDSGPHTIVVNLDTFDIISLQSDLPTAKPGITVDVQSDALRIYGNGHSWDFSAATLSGTGLLQLDDLDVSVGLANHESITSLGDGATLRGRIDNGATLTISDANTRFEMLGSSTVGGLSGSGEIDLVSGDLTLNTTGFPGFSGTIDGDGGLVKTGAGMQTLTGDLTYTGQTTIQQGTLQIGDAFTGITSKDFVSTIVNNATLVIDTTHGDFNYKGAAGISGTGALIKRGTGIASIGLGNTYTGNTTIESGELRGQIDGSGTLDIKSGATFRGLASSRVGTLTGSGTLVMEAGALTAGGANTDSTFSGTIEGAGGLVKTGTGTLTLSGMLYYTGTTTIESGTLKIGDATGIMSDYFESTIVNNGALIIDARGTTGGFFYKGDAGISGTGSLTKEGDNTADLGDAHTHTYAGPTTVNGGVLVGAIANDAALTLANGTTSFYMRGASRFGSLHGTGTIRMFGGDLTVGSDDTSTTFGGMILSISGSGLVKTGSGTLTLTGQLFYNGTTTINGGTLRLGDATGLTTLAFPSTIVNNSQLVIDTTTRNFTYNASAGISGTGSLTVMGGNMASIGLGNTYSGATTIDGGVLRGQIDSDGALTIAAGAEFRAMQSSRFGALAGNGLLTIEAGDLTIDGNAGSTFGGTITGAAGSGLIKNGAGTLTLTGNSTYTGPTTINAGVLEVNGSLLSAAVVNNGGTLMGSGTVGGVDVQSGGVLAPGNSIGTLTVDGDATFRAGSVFRVEADDAGNADLLDVDGKVTINGGTVDVRATGTAYDTAIQYTILNATDGVSGKFTNVTTDLAFLSPTLNYDANSVYLTLIKGGNYCDVATTRNQRALCGVLENAAGGATGDLQTVISTLNSLSAAQARAAFNSIGGASIAHLRRAGVAFVNGFGDMLSRRLHSMATADAARANGPIMLAAVDRPSDIGMADYGMSGQPAARHGLWMRAHGLWQDYDGDRDMAGSKLSGGALTIGADTRLKNDWVVGVSFSAGRTNLEFDGIDDDGYARGRAIGAYAGFTSGAWIYRGHLAYAWYDNHMEREVLVGGLTNTVESDFDSHSILLHGEASVDLPMGGWTLQPLIGMQVLHARSDGFTEKGAGGLNLKVDADRSTSVRTLIGAKTVHDFGKLRIEPRLVWSHDFGDINEPVKARLAAAPAAGSFQSYGAEAKRDSLIAGLGVSGEVRKGVSLFGDVQLNYNSRQHGVAALVGLRSSW